MLVDPHQWNMFPTVNTLWVKINFFVGCVVHSEGGTTRKRF